jgi:predicted DNA-binding transcriptional regulator YafY
MEAVQETLIFDVPQPYATPASATLLTLSVAAQQRRSITMRYRAWGDRETERAFDPYGVVHYHGRWFTVGYCHLRAGLRLFRLDRVLRAEIGDARFDRPDDFDSLAYVVASLASAPGSWQVDVLLETSLDQARQRVPDAMAVLETAPGGVLLRCYVENLDWMARFLVGLGFRMLVRRPQELRAVLGRLAAEIAEAAGREELVEVGATIAG